ncbi:Tudor domain-containing protein 5 [Apostichopus japonicus]|uniref:Tudor domain-containing protein 5 n=2 Tax=Stichopus japonicus TaxID=307972 RepID=A0A2G8JVX9_STIJA|nr:Tudor domain-containing protein 5 [Apostichopus japonicus]
MNNTNTVAKLPDSEKRSVRAVLFSEWGVPLDEFEKDYKALESKSFPYKSYGFSSLQECLQSIPDVVRFEFSQKASRWILYAVADETSFMSSFTKKKQLSNTKAGLPNKRRNRRQGRDRRRDERTTRDKPERTGNGVPLLVRSHRGLFTIVVKCRDTDITLQEINELIQSTAPVAEMNSYMGYNFFRYKEMHEAQAVIQKFNGFVLKGKKLQVQPAEEKVPAHENRKSDRNSINKQSQPGMHHLPSLLTAPPLYPGSGLLRDPFAPYMVPPAMAGYSQKPPAQMPQPSYVNRTNSRVNSQVTSNVRAPMTSDVNPPPVTSETISSADEVESLPPPLLDDEDESEDDDLSVSSEDDGPPPLIGDSDSDSWSDSDEIDHGEFRPPPGDGLNGGMTNGYLKKSTEGQTEHYQLKKVSPGRGRGLLNFQHR